MTGPNDPRREPGEEQVPEDVRRAWDRLGREEPPDLVDQAVLNRAKAAVDRPHSSRPWSFGWPHALTTAAVIVLAVTLLLPLRETGQPGGTPERFDPPSTAGDRTRIRANGVEESAVQEDVEVAPATRALPRTAADEPAEALAEPQADPSPAPRAVVASPALETVVDEPKKANRISTIPEVTDRLQAIRELVDAGELDAAREALAALQRDFPDTELPDDLEALRVSPPETPRS